MSISRVSGRMLQDNLQRDDDIAVDTDLLYIDVSNRRIGVNTDLPSEELDVTGNCRVGNVLITEIGITVSNSGNLVLYPVGNVDVSNKNIVNVADPVKDTDAVNKRFLQNTVTGIEFFLSDGTDSETIAAGDTITILGTANEIVTAITADDTLTVGLPADVEIQGNLSVGETLTVGNVNLSDIISGGNISVTGNIEGNSIIANSSFVGSYLDSNALVFTDGSQTLVTYESISYTGAGSIEIVDVGVTVDSLSLAGNTISANTAIEITSTDSVTAANLKVQDYESPNLVYFANASGYVSTDSNLSFNGSTLGVTGTVAGNIITVDNRIDSPANITLLPETSSFVVVNSKTGVVMPAGTTFERPADSPAGTLRWNQDTLKLEVYDGANWNALGIDLTTITSQQLSGDNSTTTFLLDQEATTTGVLVNINGVAQLPVTAYNVAGDQLTFAEAPLETDSVEIRFISLTSVVQAITSSSGATLVRATDADTIKFIVSGNTVGVVNSDGIQLFGNDVGLTDSQQRAENANTTLTLADRGNHIYSTTSAPQTIEIPNDAEVQFPIGSQIEIVSHGTANIQLVKQSEVELYLAGNSVDSTRTITAYGHARLLKVDQDTWSVTGTGII